LGNPLAFVIGTRYKKVRSKRGISEPEKGKKNIPLEERSVKYCLGRDEGR